MIHAECLQEAGIDYSAGLERFMNDPDLYEAVLSAFAGEDLPERAQAAYRSGDRAALQKVAHEAKGSGGNAGLDRVYTAANALLTLLRGGACTDGELDEAYLRFETVYLAARDAIRASLR